MHETGKNLMVLSNNFHPYCHKQIMPIKMLIYCEAFSIFCHEIKTCRLELHDFDASNSHVIISSIDVDLPEPKTGTRLKIGSLPISILPVNSPNS